MLVLNKNYVLKKDAISIVVEPKSNNSNKQAIHTININESILDFLILCDGTRGAQDIYVELAKLYGGVTAKVLEDDFKDIIQVLSHLDIIRETSFETAQKPQIIREDELLLPSAISVETTNGCQLNCKHCFQSYNLNKSVRYIDVEKLEEIFNKCNDYNVQSIFLTGGEILLHPKAETIIELAIANFSSVTVATNGMVNISNQFLQKIAKKNVKFQVSIDGDERYHNLFRGNKGAYQKANETIKKLVSRGFETTIAYTLNVENVKYVEKELLKFREIGVTQFAIGSTTNSGNTEANNIEPISLNHFIELSKELQKHQTADFFIGTDCSIQKFEEEAQKVIYPNKCGAGYKTIHIDTDLKVFPCVSLWGIMLGDLSTTNLKEIISFNNLEEMLNMQSPTPSICKLCKNDFQCGGCISNMEIEKQKRNCILYEQNSQL